MRMPTRARCTATPRATQGRGVRGRLVGVMETVGGTVRQQIPSGGEGGQPGVLLAQQRVRGLRRPGQPDGEVVAEPPQLVVPAMRAEPHGVIPRTPRPTRRERQQHPGLVHLVPLPATFAPSHRPARTLAALAESPRSPSPSSRLRSSRGDPIRGLLAALRSHAPDAAPSGQTLPVTALGLVVRHWLGQSCVPALDGQPESGQHYGNERDAAYVPGNGRPEYPSPGQQPR